MIERGVIRFIKPPDFSEERTSNQLIRENVITAPGGFCAPIAAPYSPFFNTERPVRDALVQMMDLAIQRMRLPEDERPAFDIVHRGYCVTGREDVTARLAEHRDREDDDWDDDEESDGVAGHRWDQLIRLVWVGRLGGR